MRPPRPRLTSPCTGLAMAWSVPGGCRQGGPGEGLLRRDAGGVIVGLGITARSRPAVPHPCGRRVVGPRPRPRRPGGWAALRAAALPSPTLAFTSRPLHLEAWPFPLVEPRRAACGSARVETNVGCVWTRPRRRVPRLVRRAVPCCSQQPVRPRSSLNCCLCLIQTKASRRAVKARSAV